VTAATSSKPLLGSPVGDDSVAGFLNSPATRGAEGKPDSSGARAAAPPTPRLELDAAAEDLRRHRDEWVALPLGERIGLLEALIRGFRDLAEEWVAISREVEGVAGGDRVRGEEWIAGPYCVLRDLRLLRDSLSDLADGSAPRLPGPPTVRDGRVVAPVFPASLWDRAFFPGVTAEVWMEPEVPAGRLADHQAAAYREASAPAAGRVALVLGAGNVSSIGPMDAAHKLFVEKQVVLYKSHPVQDPLGPLVERAFAPLVERGFVRVVYGGAEVGAYLVDHPGVDEIHVTGSDRTYEAMVFGPGDKGARRKARGERRLAKRVTAELGNVSPWIVVPAAWTPSDLAFQAENLVSSLANNAGFNCNATRVIVTWKGWPQRDELLDRVGDLLAATPVRPAFYPGAADRFDRFLAAHPAARTFGERSGEVLPWAFLRGLDPDADDEIAFRVEAFCGLFAEVAIDAPSPARFVEHAVDFANERLWGSLNVTLTVHPDALADPETAAAVRRAEADLRYGTVSLNHWAAVGYALCVTPWGAFPGHPPEDIQSGTGFVHNTFLFDRPQKSVVRAPFRPFPKPPWFTSHAHAGPLSAELARFEAAPSVARLPRIFWHALRG